MAGKRDGVGRGDLEPHDRLRSHFTGPAITCYALALAKRLKAMRQAKYQLDGDPRTSGARLWAVASFRRAGRPPGMAGAEDDLRQQHVPTSVMKPSPSTSSLGCWR